VISSNTIDANSATVGGAGVYCADFSDPSVSNTIITGSTAGAAITNDSFSNPTTSCCDFFGNAGGDGFPGSLGGNFSQDPQYCGVAGSGNYYLQSDSPCAPGNHPGGSNCGLIGAFPVGCGTTSIRHIPWGALKDIYRE